ncbi:sensor histidine kinase [Aeromicrobium sp.]|uniref:sensor histidine kinase n=1 Tax=Aeromicrobium sp. TaxID=1871063 RepID=UPI003D6A3AD5
MPPPFYGPPRRFWLFGPIALAFVQVVGTFGAARNQLDAREPDVVAVLIAVAGPMSLYGLRRRPRTVLLFVTAITAAYVVMGYPYGPVFASFVGAAVVNIAGSRRVEAWGAVGAVVILALTAHAVVTDEWSWGWFAGVLAWSLLVLAAGELVRLNRARMIEFRRARAEERRREAGEERLRIARELHDVVAHHMSLIHVQAGVALHLVDRRPEQVETALTTIKDASKEALTELRDLIGVLRAEGELAPRAPVARLDALDDLADRASHTGVTTTVEVSGDLDAVPAAVGTAAYRIVQEAVTNVVRHSGATRARIGLVVGLTELDVSVIDNGSGPGDADGGQGVDHGGTGLRGMRERASALGGSVDLSPDAGGGARLHAILPLGSAS